MNIYIRLYKCTSRPLFHILNVSFQITISKTKVCYKNLQNIKFVNFTDIRHIKVKDSLYSS